jgi:hypothetical protein
MLSSYTSEVTVNDAEPTTDRNDGGTGARITGAVLSLLVGAIYGTVGTVAHQNVVRIGEAALPVGLVLALVGALALLVGFRLLFTSRLSVLCAAIGLVGMIALFSIASAGGSVLIPEGVTGLVWTVVPVLLATVVVAWPRMPHRPVATPGTTPVPPNPWDRPEA